MLAVQTARLINMQSGGTVIAPWDVEQLDEEWIEVFMGLSDLPALTADYQKFETRLSEIRSKHPTYRKYTS